MVDQLQYWLLDPVALLFLASLATIGSLLLFRRRKSRGRKQRGASLWQWALCVLWAVLFIFCAAPSVVNPVLATLENQYPGQVDCDSGSHLIVLGGGVDSRVKVATEFERMSPATMARATAASRMLLQEPQLRVIVAGGALRSVTEADVIAEYLMALGINDSRILREGQSANTYENATQSASILNGVEIDGPVRLVTSAMHMPRALGTFRKAFEEQDIELCPVSVDRQSFRVMPLWAWLPQTTSIVKFNKWLHEVVAIAVYRSRGWME